MLKKSIFLPLCFQKIFDQFCFSVWRVLTFKTAAADRFQSKKAHYQKRTLTNTYILFLIMHTTERAPLVLVFKSSQRRQSCSALKVDTERHFGQKQFWDPPVYNIKRFYIFSIFCPLDRISVSFEQIFRCPLKYGI